MREEIIFGNAPTLEHILDALSEIETIVNAKQREPQFEARCRLKDFGYQPHRFGMFPDITCDKTSVNPLKQVLSTVDTVATPRITRAQPLAAKKIRGRKDSLFLRERLKTDSIFEFTIPLSVRSPRRSTTHADHCKDGTFDFFWYIRPSGEHVGKGWIYSDCVWCAALCDRPPCFPMIPCQVRLLPRVI